MAIEIERKFLIINDDYRQIAVSHRHIVQGYLSVRPESTVRVRIIDGKEAQLTIKSVTVGATRNEWEYSIPVNDAREMLECIDPTTVVVEKTRYIVPAPNGLKWEVDEFHGALAPLVTAEVELPAEDTQIQLPTFVGREVTGVADYYNSSLSKRRQASSFPEKS